jgi:hypothetical protein
MSQLPPDQRRSIDVEGSEIHGSQLGQGERLTQIQADHVTYVALFDNISSLNDLIVRYNEFIGNTEKRLIKVLLGVWLFYFLIILTVNGVFNATKYAQVLTSIRWGVISLSIASFWFLVISILSRYTRSVGTFWGKLSQSEKKILDRFLDKVQSEIPMEIRENFDNPSRLDENYVPLSGSLYRHQAYEEKAPRFRRQISNLDAYITSPVNKRIFIFGSPGSGKSTTLYKTFLTYRQQVTNRKGAYIPVFIHANQISQILSVSRDTTTTDIVDFLSEVYSGDISAETQSFINIIRRYSDINLILIVDALDEFVDKAKRGQLFDYLSSWIDKTYRRRTKWILSCREEEYRGYANKLNVADVRIKPMSLIQVEEFLRKRLKKLEFTDEESHTIRYALRGISRAGIQEETFLRNPYYLSLWLFLLAVEKRDGSPAIPSIDKLHTLELKREIAKVKGNSLKNVDDNLVDITTKILSVLSFHLLKISLQTEVHQGVHLSDPSLLKSIVEILLPINDQSYDLLTQSRLRKYSSLIAKNSNYESEAIAEDINFLKLLKVLTRSITRHSALTTGNKDVDIQLAVVIASVVEQAHRNNLIEMNIEQASFFRFFNQRAADYLAACFLRRINSKRSRV